MVKVNSGDSEFGGGSGLILPQNYDNMTDVEWMWALKATNPGDPLALDGSEQIDPARVGKPESYQQTFDGSMET